MNGKRLAGMVLVAAALAFAPAGAHGSPQALEGSVTTASKTLTVSVAIDPIHHVWGSASLTSAASRLNISINCAWVEERAGGNVWNLSGSEVSGGRALYVTVRVRPLPAPSAWVARSTRGRGMCGAPTKGAATGTGWFVQVAL
jgi:hypothetical protein